jgi:D-alanyl-lipoteichoic acid acyltransferase DltB (MBOAT superfamily)
MLLNLLKDIFAYNPKSPLLFTQFYFWAFFAFVFAGFSLFKNKILLRNTFLFFVSLFFYFKTSGLFVILLVFNTFFNYFQAIVIHRSRTKTTLHVNLVIGLLINLFFLSYFKYAYFFTDLVNTILHTHFRVFDIFSWFGNALGGNGRFDISNILLPVGISFYTFQNISYLMDVFRKRVKPVKNIFNFGFYVSFFPQLVAGPIVRASEFIPQIYKKYFLSQRQFGIAVFWILNGLAKKIILGDYLAVNFIDRVFENPMMYSGFENLMALFGYSLQVYADFSGYTDIAMGVAMLMGFYLPKNFNSPYKATNAGNFWKRWHISLSRWLQDYLYIPLGGSRKATFGTYFLIVAISSIALALSGNPWLSVALLSVTAVLGFVVYQYPHKKKKIDTNINLMNTMLIGGLWHGASWNFMIWGGLNGLGIIVYKFWKDWSIYARTIVLFLLMVLFFFLSYFFKKPVFNIGLVWIGILFLGTLVRFIYSLFNGRRPFQYIETCWAILQTFVFITFTRLFFRSGSNLNPNEANQVAWDTAQQMVNQIGSKWNLSVIGDMIYEYRYVFSFIVIGLIIHWLPENWKRYYRLRFARLPFIALALTVVGLVFFIYQFITADLQTFIYFQF